MAGKAVHFKIPLDDTDLGAGSYGRAFGWKLDQWGPMEYWTTTAGDGGGTGGALTKRSEDSPGFTFYIEVDDHDVAPAAIETAGRPQQSPTGEFKPASHSRYMNLAKSIWMAFTALRVQDHLMANLNSESEDQERGAVIFQAIFIALIVLISISIILQFIVRSRKVHNPVLLKLFTRVGRIGSVANGVMFIGSFLFLLVGVIVLLATSK